MSDENNRSLQPIGKLCPQSARDYVNEIVAPGLTGYAAPRPHTGRNVEVRPPGILPPNGALRPDPPDRVAGERRKPAFYTPDRRR